MLLFILIFCIKYVSISKCFLIFYEFDFVLKLGISLYFPYYFLFLGCDLTYLRLLIKKLGMSELITVTLVCSLPFVIFLTLVYFIPVLSSFSLVFLCLDPVFPLCLFLFFDFSLNFHGFYVIMFTLVPDLLVLSQLIQNVISLLTFLQESRDFGFVSLKNHKVELQN